ncbi:MAG: NfeD family protein [Phycisphaeraceae bacterium]
MAGWTNLQLALAQAAPASQNAQASGDDTQWMVFAIIAFGVAITLMVLEAFLPSGGVLGLLAGFCALAGVVMFFMFDDMWGMVSMAVSLLAAPFAVAAMLWVWPNTPIGRALTLDDEQPVANQNGLPNEPEGGIAVGLEGEALTDLRPVGACRLDGRRIDCLSQSGVIERGTPVRVIGVEGSRIRVRAV